MYSWQFRFYSKKIEIHYESKVLTFRYATTGHVIATNTLEENKVLFEEAAPYIEREIRSILEKYFNKTAAGQEELKKIKDNTKKVTKF